MNLFRCKLDNCYMAMQTSSVGHWVGHVTCNWLKTCVMFLTLLVFEIFFAFIVVTPRVDRTILLTASDGCGVK